ncbi:hypothetical protein ALC56_14112, partial [Trachymyrmex septentrionalis]
LDFGLQDFTGLHRNSSDFIGIHEGAMDGKHVAIIVRIMNTSYYCGYNYADKVSANGQIIEGEWRSTYKNTNNYSNNSHYSNNYSKHSRILK